VAQIHRLRIAREEARAIGADVSTVLKIEAAETKAAGDLAKLSGELSPLDENRLTRTAKFAALVDALARALRPYPEARAAVAAALAAQGVPQ
jgi:hypothetical protein